MTRPQPPRALHLRSDGACTLRLTKALRALRYVVVLTVVLAAAPARADRVDFWLFGLGGGVGGATIPEPTVTLPVHVGFERLTLLDDRAHPAAYHGHSVGLRGELMLAGNSMVYGASVQYDRLGWTPIDRLVLRTWGGRLGVFRAPVSGEGTLTYLGGWAVWRYRNGVVNLMLSAGVAFKVAGQLEYESGQYTPQGAPIMTIDQGPPVVLLVSADFAAYMPL